MGVFRVRLSESAQSGSARQVLQSLWIVGQTRVIGDMLHVVESCVNDFRGRSSWIPGSWHLRMVYTDGIPFHEPSQESNRAGQHHESHR